MIPAGPSPAGLAALYAADIGNRTVGQRRDGSEAAFQRSIDASQAPSDANIEVPQQPVERNQPANTQSASAVETRTGVLDPRTAVTRRADVQDTIELSSAAQALVIQPPQNVGQASATEGASAIAEQAFSVAEPVAEPPTRSFEAARGRNLDITV